MSIDLNNKIKDKAVRIDTYILLSDDALIEQLKQSDKNAFNELYNRYWQSAITLAFVKIKNEEEAKEIVQSLFIELWHRRENILIQSSFQCYIAGALKYKIYSFFAKKQKETKVLQALQTTSEINNTEEWLDYEALRNDLEKAVLKLPEKCQQVYRLSRESGYSGKQIANHLGISHKTVENHLTKALQHVRYSLRSLFM